MDLNDEELSNDDDDEDEIDVENDEDVKEVPPSSSCLDENPLAHNNDDSALRNSVGKKPSFSIDNLLSHALEKSFRSNN